MFQNMRYVRLGLGVGLFIRLYSLRGEQIGVELVFDSGLRLGYLTFGAIRSTIGRFMLSFHVVYVYVAFAKYAIVSVCAEQ